MYRITHGATHDLQDAAEFIEMLNDLPRHPVAEARTLFDGESDIIVTRAPGRLDVMGGIADYSGSLVLQLPIKEAALVALQKDESRTLKIVSLGAEANDRAHYYEMPLAEFARDGKPIDYLAAREFFRRGVRQSWAAYVAGAFLVLMRERGMRFAEGARILIHSRVPEGKGVSSSAAIEVAVMTAVCAVFRIELAPRDIALLCQIVENAIVGAPCGVMDQMTSVCGEEGKMLALLCQPAEVRGAVSLPDELSIWGIDSGVRHAVGAGDYGSVRAGAFMGYRMIAAAAGMIATPTQDESIVAITDTKWRGYLANLAPSEFDQFYTQHLPESMEGDKFLREFGGTTDAATRVQPQGVYFVRAATAHPVYENFRVRAFAELLGEELNERKRELLGELMYQSHASYGRCGLGSHGTDKLVELVRASGDGKGLYGARPTGGGSGGTVAVLGTREAGGAVRSVAEEYERETNRRPGIFDGSSPGAVAFGHIELRRTS